MKKFILTVRDDFFKIELSGEFFANTLEKAIAECREFYAMELDTNPEDINIVKIEEA